MRKAVYLWLSLTALLLGGCGVTSLHPASELTASEPLPAALAGTWKVEEILGGPPSQVTTLTLSQKGDGSVAVKLQEGTQVQEESASLADLSGQRVLSVPSATGVWTLFALENGPSTGQITIRQLDASVIKQDIQQGVIAGEVSDIGGGSVVLQITATTASLRAYLQSTPSAFGDPVAVLKAPDPVP